MQLWYWWRAAIVHRHERAAMTDFMEDALRITRW